MINEFAECYDESHVASALGLVTARLCGSRDLAQDLRSDAHFVRFDMSSFTFVLLFGIVTTVNKRDDKAIATRQVSNRSV